MEPALKPSGEFRTAAKVGFTPGDKNKRFIAFLIDALIAGSASKFLAVFLFKPMHMSPLMTSLAEYLIPTIIYWIGLTLQFGATPGKKIMGLKIVDAGGNVDLGIGQLFLRETIGRLASTLPLMLGYAWVSWDKERRTFHDMIAKTRVVDYR